MKYEIKKNCAYIKFKKKAQTSKQLHATQRKK